MVVVVVVVVVMVVVVPHFPGGNTLACATLHTVLHTLHTLCLHHHSYNCLSTHTLTLLFTSIIATAEVRSGQGHLALPCLAQHH